MKLPLTPLLTTPTVPNPVDHALATSHAAISREVSPTTGHHPEGLQGKLTAEQVRISIGHDPEHIIIPSERTVNPVDLNAEEAQGVQSDLLKITSELESVISNLFPTERQHLQEWQAESDKSIIAGGETQLPSNLARYIELHYVAIEYLKSLQEHNSPLPSNDVMQKDIQVHLEKRGESSIKSYLWLIIIYVKMNNLLKKKYPAMSKHLRHFTAFLCEYEVVAVSVATMLSAKEALMGSGSKKNTKARRWKYFTIGAYLCAILTPVLGGPIAYVIYKKAYEPRPNRPLHEQARRDAPPMPALELGDLDPRWPDRTQRPQSDANNTGLYGWNEHGGNNVYAGRYAGHTNTPIRPVQAPFSAVFGPH